MKSPWPNTPKAFSTLITTVIAAMTAKLVRTSNAMRLNTDLFSGRLARHAPRPRHRDKHRRIECKGRLPLGITAFAVCLASESDQAKPETPAVRFGKTTLRS